MKIYLNKKYKFIFLYIQVFFFFYLFYFKIKLLKYNTRKNNLKMNPDQNEITPIIHARRDLFRSEIRKKNNS